MLNGKWKMENGVQEQEQVQVQEFDSSLMIQFHTTIHSFIHSLSVFKRIPYTLYHIPLYLVFLFLSTPLYAQRSEINEGVDQYKEEKYADAEVNFKKGKEKAPENFEAHFNLGDAYYKQGRYDESLKVFYSSLE